VSTSVQLSGNFYLPLLRLIHFLEVHAAVGNYCHRHADAETGQKENTMQLAVVGDFEWGKGGALSFLI
jgi:hypothetical protein